MPHVALTIYRVQMRCTLRARPSKASPTLTRLGTTLDNGSPRLVTGWEQAPGWVEVVADGTVQGYIKRGALRELSG
jgi:hypothetical protein